MANHMTDANGIDLHQMLLSLEAEEWGDWVMGLGMGREGLKPKQDGTKYREASIDYMCERRYPEGLRKLAIEDKTCLRVGGSGNIALELARYSRWFPATITWFFTSKAWLLRYVSALTGEVFLLSMNDARKALRGRLSDFKTSGVVNGPSTEHFTHLTYTLLVPVPVLLELCPSTLICRLPHRREPTEKDLAKIQKLFPRDKLTPAFLDEQFHGYFGRRHPAHVAPAADALDLMMKAANGYQLSVPAKPPSVAEQNAFTGNNILKVQHASILRRCKLPQGWSESESGLVVPKDKLLAAV